MYNKAILKFGHEAQRKKAIEELKELIIELERPEIQKDMLESEIADVTNMIPQLCIMYNLSTLRIGNIAGKKMERCLRSEYKCK